MQIIALIRDIQKCFKNILKTLTQKFYKNNLEMGKGLNSVFFSEVPVLVVQLNGRVFSSTHKALIRSPAPAHSHSSDSDTH